MTVKAERKAGERRVERMDRQKGELCGTLVGIVPSRNGTTCAECWLAQ